MTTIGDLIRDHREAIHLSQSKLAARAGFDHSYVSRIEGGSREPSRDAVLFLAEALDLDTVQTDEMLCAGGFLPVDPDSLLADEPELVAVLTVLRDPATPDVRRVGIRAMLGALADLGVDDRSDRTVQDMPVTVQQSAATPSKGVERYVGSLRPSQATTGPIPRVPADDLMDALVAPHGKAA